MKYSIATFPTISMMVNIFCHGILSKGPTASSAAEPSTIIPLSYIVFLLCDDFPDDDTYSSNDIQPNASLPEHRCLHNTSHNAFLQHS